MFKRGDIVEIRPSRAVHERWYGTKAKVLEDQFNWPAKDLVLCQVTEDLDLREATAEKKDLSVLQFTPEGLHKLLTEAVAEGIKVAPTAGDYTPQGAAYHLMKTHGYS